MNCPVFGSVGVGVGDDNVPAGILGTVKKEFPQIELIKSDMHAGATTELAKEKAQNLLTRYRDEVEGIFCPNESSTHGMLVALEAGAHVM